MRETGEQLQGCGPNIKGRAWCLVGLSQISKRPPKKFPVILGLYGDNGKENGNYYNGLYGDNGKENGNYYRGCHGFGRRGSCRQQELSRGVQPLVLTK